MTWIPVTERPPDDDRSVLIYSAETNIQLGCYYNHLNMWWWSEFDKPNVTHWMELPAAPGANP